MSDELTAAYVAAAVSIIGIGINIIISITSRLLDGIEKRKQSRVHAIEQYYVPLNILIDKLAHELNQFEKITSVTCTTDVLIEFLSNNESVPAKGLCLINNIRLHVNELREFFNTNQYHYYPDYQLKRLHDLIRTTVETINQSLQQETIDQIYITKDIKHCIELFRKRLCSKTVKLYTYNPYHRLFPDAFIRKNNLLK